MAAASDLAAMGASPQALLLALTLPEADRVWLEGFSRGLAEARTAIGAPLVGGDTTRGSLSLTVTVLGSTPADQYLTRSGAQPGDRLCVSGTLGDAAAGLAVLSGQLAVDESAAAFLTTRYIRPAARLALGQALRDCATACIDISDGLLSDAAHIASASGVRLEIDRRCCHCPRHSGHRRILIRVWIGRLQAAMTTSCFYATRQYALARWLYGNGSSCRGKRDKL